MFSSTTGMRDRLGTPGAVGLSKLGLLVLLTELGARNPGRVTANAQNKPSTRATQTFVCSTQVIAFLNVGCHTEFHLV